MKIDLLKELNQLCDTHLSINTFPSLGELSKSHLTMLSYSDLKSYISSLVMDKSQISKVIVAPESGFKEQLISKVG